MNIMSAKKFGAPVQVSTVEPFAKEMFEARVIDKNRETYKRIKGFYPDSRQAWSEKVTCFVSVANENSLKINYNMAEILRDGYMSDNDIAVAINDIKSMKCELDEKEKEKINKEIDEAIEAGLASNAMTFEEIRNG